MSRPTRSPSIEQILAALGYAIGPSPRFARRRITRVCDGAVIGDMDAGECLGWLRKTGQLADERLTGKSETEVQK